MGEASVSSMLSAGQQGWGSQPCATVGGGTCLYLANLLCGKMGGRRGGEGRGGKGRRYSLANFKLDQMGSSEGLRSGLGYQVGRESMLVCLGRPVNVVCTRVRVLC